MVLDGIYVPSLSCDGAEVELHYDAIFSLLQASISQLPACKTLCLKGTGLRVRSRSAGVLDSLKAVATLVTVKTVNVSISVVVQHAPRSTSRTAMHA